MGCLQILIRIKIIKKQIERELTAKLNLIIFTIQFV